MNIATVEGYRDLQPKTKRWIRGIVSEWQLEEHHMRLLVLAGGAYDRALSAKALVDADGPCVLNRFDVKVSHPMIDVWKQSSITFCRLLREVGLDLAGPEETRPKSRPGGY